MKLPPGWRMAHLGELCEHRLGKMLDAEKNKGILRPYLRNPNVQWFTFDLTELKQMRFEDSELADYEVCAGDVIICEGGEAGRAAVWGDGHSGLLIQKALHRVRCGSELLNRFLVYRLYYDAQTGRLREYFTGTTIPHFTGQDLHEYRFPLPPLPEQKRIAAILDKADAIRRRRREAMLLAERLIPSLFYEVFGYPDVNPRQFGVVSLDEIIADAQYGTAAKANSEGRGMPVLRMNNVTFEGGFDLSDIKWVELPDDERDRVTVRRGDLLFNRTNSRELVGKTAVWERDDCYAFAGYLIRVRFRMDRAFPEYVCAFLNSSYGKKMLYTKAQPSINMSNMSAAMLRRMVLPLPPLELQREFVVRVHRIRATRERWEQTAAEPDDLFNALVQRAFRGEL